MRGRSASQTANMAWERCGPAKATTIMASSSDGMESRVSRIWFSTAERRPWVAPAKTPDAAVAWLNAQVNDVLKDPEVVARLEAICSGLVAHGLPATMPAAVVEQASLPGERCIAGTLASLPTLAFQHSVRPPALIIVGEVVGLRQQLTPWLRRSLTAAMDEGVMQQACA